jgi:iron uptake system EfeUOB component EfeO/EfeM
MKSTRTLVVLALAITSSFGLAACSSSNTNTSATPSSTDQAKSSAGTTQEKPKQEAPKQDASSIKSGVTKMMSTSADLKKAVDAGDEAMVKTTAPQLEETWKTFEDDVKSKYPDLYKKLEASLNPAVAGSKATPLNKEAIGKLNDQLNQTLNELAGKEK